MKSSAFPWTHFVLGALLLSGPICLLVQRQESRIAGVAIAILFAYYFARVSMSLSSTVVERSDAPESTVPGELVRRDLFDSGRHDDDLVRSPDELARQIRLPLLAVVRHSI